MREFNTKKCGKTGCNEKAEKNQAHCRSHLFRLDPTPDLSIKIREETTSCRFCGDQTIRLSTKMCDECWELRGRLKMVDYDVLMEIIRDINSSDLAKIVEGIPAE